MSLTPPGFQVSYKIGAKLSISIVDWRIEIRQWVKLNHHPRPIIIEDAADELRSAGNTFCVAVATIDQFHSPQPGTMSTPEEESAILGCH